MEHGTCQTEYVCADFAMSSHQMADYHKQGHKERCQDSTKQMTKTVKNTFRNKVQCFSCIRIFPPDFFNKLPITSIGWDISFLKSNKVIPPYHAAGLSPKFIFFPLSQELPDIWHSLSVGYGCKHQMTPSAFTGRYVQHRSCDTHLNTFKQIAY